MITASRTDEDPTLKQENVVTFSEQDNGGNRVYTGLQEPWLNQIRRISEFREPKQ